MILGIDIGGTKTQAVLFDEKGNAIKEKETGSCHLMNASSDEIITRLKQVNLDSMASVVIGYAGYGRSPEMRQEIRRLVDQAFGGRDVTLISDLELAEAAALEGKDGTMVILGTGSVVVSVHEEKTVKKGGWGYLLGDEGSGYAIGREVLRTFALEADGRMKKDAVFPEVEKMYGLSDPNELIAAVMEGSSVRRTEIARAAEIATGCADACESCRTILKKQAEKAADLIRSVAEAGETVAGMGGMMHAQNYIDLINEAGNHTFTLVPSKHEPVYGAYVLKK